MLVCAGEMNGYGLVDGRCGWGRRTAVGCLGQGLVCNFVQGICHADVCHEVGKVRGDGAVVVIVAAAAAAVVVVVVVVVVIVVVVVAVAVIVWRTPVETEG